MLNKKKQTNERIIPSNEHKQQALNKPTLLQILITLTPLCLFEITFYLFSSWPYVLHKLY